MKLEQRDFRKLRWHLIGTTGLILMAGLIALASSYSGKPVHRDNAAAKNKYQTTDNRLRQVRTEEQEIRDKTALFAELRSRGAVGEEKRLEWTEKLRQIRRELRLPDISYEFSPQIALEGSGSKDYAYYNSPMKIHLQLLHEGDLLNFLARLREEASAFVLVRSCRIKRLPAASGDPKTAPATLSADCEMDWITLHQPSTGK